MKRLTVLLAVLCLVIMPLSAQDSPLDIPVTLDMDNVTLEEVIDAMMGQTGVMFLYKSTDLGASGKVSVHVTAAPIRQVLRQLNVDARVEGRNLILMRRDALQLHDNRNPSLPVKSRMRMAGRVVDGNGEPLVGATVMIHGTSEGTTTDLDGNYSMSVADGDWVDALLIGYKTVSRKAASRLDFVLEDDITQLEEVVVVGYGVQKKVNLTGSVESLGGEAMENLPMPSLSRGLQGMIPSLNIDMTDGKPIRSSEYNVRGTTSIGAGGGSTLIMIDGAPGDPDLLNPGDIESVTVLKDAASAAIYGARGPFGVVLITTKNPSEGKTSLTYSGNVSFYTQTQRNDYIWDGYTWAKSFVEAYYAYNDYVTNPTGVNNAFPFTPNLETWLSELKRRQDDPSLPKVATTSDGRYVYYGSTNWYDELYKKVSTGGEHTLTLSGSARNVGYYLSGRYYGQGGIFKYNSDDFNQFNLRGKGYVQAFPWLKVSDNVDFSRRSYKYPLTSIYEKGIWRNIADQGFPMAVMYNPDGTMTRHAAYTVGDFKTGNNKSLTTQFNLRNTLGAVASFLDNSLRFNGDFTYSYRLARDKRILYPVSYSDYEGVITSEGTNKLSEGIDETNYLGTNFYAEYENTFRGRHYLKAMAGVNYEYQKTVTNDMERNGILKPNIADFNLANGDSFLITGGGSAWAVMGLFCRLNYNYKERYLVELNGRYDASSNFPRNSMWGFFPSASAGWRVSKEDFWRISPKAVSELKIRLSYGELGNGQIPPYSYIQTISTYQSGRIIDGALPLYSYMPSLVPDDLTWERSRTYNVGIDLGFLENRLTLNADFFQRNTENMYTTGVIVPAVLGTSSPKGNYADLRTRGLELSLEWKDRIAWQKSLDYSVKLVLSDSQAEITRYNNPNGLIDNVYYKGAKVGEIWGYEIVGLFQDENEIASWADQSYMKTSQGQKIWLPGDMKYADLNQDGKINDGKRTVDEHGDMRVIGNTTPRWRFGVNLSASWNNFFLTAFFQGVGHRDWYPSVECNAFWGMYNRPYNMLPVHIYENHWTEETPDAYFPRFRGYLATSTNGVLRMPNTRYLQNAAYVRLKNLTFGYDIPKEVLEKVGIAKCQLFFSGQNLWTWSPIHRITKNIDPEVISGSDAEVATGKGDGNAYPMLRSCSLGVTIGF